MTFQAQTVVDPILQSPRCLGLTHAGGTTQARRISVRKYPITYLVDQPQLQSWLPGIRDVLWGYLELPPNWDSYGGGAISRDVALVVERFAGLMAALVFRVPTLVLSPQGVSSLNGRIPRKS